jgi:hypothetical protein
LLKAKPMVFFCVAKKRPLEKKMPFFLI